MVILETVEALGLIMPPTLMFQADEVFRRAARPGASTTKLAWRAWRQPTHATLAHSPPRSLKGQPPQAQTRQHAAQGTRERQSSDAYGLDPADPCRLA
jgi:hypothetical protein